jgi:hypothetical protein
MAILDISFSNEELQDFSPLPEGEYFFKIEKIELKDTLAGDGKFLSIQFCVTEGKYCKRKFFDKLNIINKSEAAQSIGRRALTQLRVVAGIPENGLTNTDQLIGTIGVAKLKVEEAANGRPAGNAAVFYKPMPAGATSAFIPVGGQPSYSAAQNVTFAAPPAKNDFPPVPTYAEAIKETKSGKVAPWMGG